MNVLSLFDGISAGQVALERAGIKVYRLSWEGGINIARKWTKEEIEYLQDNWGLKSMETIAKV